MTAEPLSRDSVVFPLVDHQTGVFERVVKAPPRGQVVFVADASGSATAIGHDSSMRRMEQVGITPTTTALVSAELAARLPQARPDHARRLTPPDI